MQVKTVLALLSLVMACWGACNTGCVRPTNYYNFTRFPLDDVISDVEFYFPSSAHPPNDYISDARAIPTITFTKTAKLKVTFLYEGAGNRNQLGFFLFHYAYNATSKQNDIPVKDYEELLIPDASYDNNCLWGGFTVDSNRTMVAGEKLGFFLRADGLCLKDPPVFYSIKEFNSKNGDSYRHIGTYFDRFRELLIFGFEDLVGLGDRDYEDTMFFFDTYGLSIDFGNIAQGCTNPPCRNGGTCNYDNGYCNCPQPNVWGAYSCHLCTCEDYADPCINKTCSPKQCIPTVWTDTTANCLSTMNAHCLNVSIVPCVSETTSTSDAPVTSSTTSSSTFLRTTGRATSTRPPSSTTDQTSSTSESSSTSDSSAETTASGNTTDSASNTGANPSNSGSNSGSGSRSSTVASQTAGTQGNSSINTANPTVPEQISESSAWTLVPLVCLSLLCIVLFV